MRKIFINFTAIAIIMFLGACSNEDLLPEANSDNARTISLTASMPDEPTTRVSLTQDGKNIQLKWEVDDKLELAFVQGEIQIKSIVKVASISSDGKKAKFDIVLPVGINAGEFDLYGVYGGGGLSDEDPTHAILPTNSEISGSLTSVQEKEHVMLHFATTKIQTAKPQVSVAFKHLGSLFSITVKNTSTISLDNLAEARLVGPEGGDWAFNSGNGGASYDLVNGQFLNIENASNYISFNAITNSLPSGESIIFWGWYPPMPNINWPELKLELRDMNDAVLYTSIIPKPLRTAPTASGKSFYFYAAWNGTQLEFTDFLHNNSVIDSRDGNVYKTVTIGNQVWMAENLKYLPSVIGPKSNSRSIPLYYVYDYDGTDVNKALSTVNYNTYGVLYNWSAAMGGFTGDIATTNKVQGACPTGWHLPSYAEWNQLTDYLGGKNVAGGKLKETGTIHWKTPNGGATNESGFTGLPGGIRYDLGHFSNIGTEGMWWYATMGVGYYAWFLRIISYDGQLYPQQNFRDQGISIRCVKTIDPLSIPTLTTTEFKVTTQTTAVSGGYIINDGGKEVVDRGVCWNKNNNPTINDSKTKNGTGVGVYKSNIEGLELNTTYYVRAYATNSEGTGYGNVTSFTTRDDGDPGYFTDSRDGNVYPTVNIGNQIWMAENLKYLPSVVGKSNYSNSNPYFFVYGYDGTDVIAAKAEPNYSTYGVLYNWPAAMAGFASSNTNPSRVEGICPAGWHLPSDAEWDQLREYLGKSGNNGGKLKENGTAHWISPNKGATNETGFTALPGGYCNYSFWNESMYGMWWSSTTANDANKAISRTLDYDVDYLYVGSSNEKGSGFSVRCVKILPRLMITTKHTFYITQTTALSGGYINDDGGEAVTARGVCWSTNNTPTINDNKTEDGNGTENFSSNITGLEKGTTYYVRAYATNRKGTVYGNVESFKTLEPLRLATITTTEITITQTTVTSGGYISHNGGAIVTARGVSWSTNNTPTIGDNKTVDGIDTYPMYDFTSNITGLVTGTTYYFRAYATNSEGTSYGNAIIFTRQQDGAAVSFTDLRDGNVYKTTSIGNQLWMAENLKYLPKVARPSTGSNTSPYYYVYNYNGTDLNVAEGSFNYKTYGVLYNWPAAMQGSVSSSINPSGTKGVCPTGWHLPSDAEWSELFNYLGGHNVAGGKLKQTGTSCWLSPNTGATNETEFSAFGGGQRYSNGSFGNLRYDGAWWSSTENQYSVNNASNPGFGYDYSTVQTYGDVKESGFSVRCVRD